MTGKAVADQWYKDMDGWAVGPRDLLLLALAIDTAIAQAVRGEREAHTATDAFTCSVMDRLQEYEFSIDGADIQEIAEETGVLVETKYDPAIHGEQDAEPGDPWDVYSEAYMAIRARTP